MEKVNFSMPGQIDFVTLNSGINHLNKQEICYQVDSCMKSPRLLKNLIFIKAFDQSKIVNYQVVNGIPESNANIFSKDNDFTERNL